VSDRVSQFADSGLRIGAGREGRLVPLGVPTRVLVGSSWAVIRLTLAVLVTEHPHLRLVGVAETPEATLGLTAALQPDVVCVLGDDRLFGPSLVVALQRSAAVVVDWEYPDPVFVRQTLDAGALGVVDKFEKQYLGRAVISAAAGRRYLSPSLDHPTIDEPGFGRLTCRQTHVVDLMAQGLSGAEIGEELGVAEDTVWKHLSDAMRRVGARTRCHLVGLRRVHDVVGWPFTAS